MIWKWHEQRQTIEVTVQSTFTVIHALITGSVCVFTADPLPISDKFLSFLLRVYTPCSWREVTTKYFYGARPNSHSQILHCSLTLSQWGADGCFWRHTWAQFPSSPRLFIPQESGRYLGDHSVVCQASECVRRGEEAPLFQHPLAVKTEFLKWEWMLNRKQGSKGKEKDAAIQYLTIAPAPASCSCV